MNDTPLVNGQLFCYALVEFRFLGQLIRDVVSIEYDMEQKKDKVYRAGETAVGFGLGNLETKCSIELGMEIVERLRAIVAGKKGLINLPFFDIDIQFKRSETDPITFHRIIGCQFQSNGVALKQGDMDFKTKFDLLVTDINFNA